MGWWPLTRGSRPVSSRPPRRRNVSPGQSFTFVTRQSTWTFLYLGKPGITYLSRVTGPGIRIWAFTAGSYDEVWEMKKKNAPANASGQKHLASIESNVLAQCHALVRHCAITAYDDGDPRKPGWITIKTFGAAWQVEAKDPDSCMSIRVVENSLDEALMLLNLLVESDEAPWEADQWLQQQASKARKK